MNKEKSQIIFETKLFSISIRAKNILRAVRLLKFEDFYGYFIESQKCIDFKKVRNCGAGTEKELNEFVTGFIKENKYENLFVDTNPPSLLDSQPLEITPKAKFEFQKQFVSLNVRAKNVLISIGADNPDIFFKEIVFNTSAKQVLEIENCGLKTYEEIQNFRNLILRLIEN
ncbi:MAG: hypothetical protein ABIO55_16685, partial [Ginsengibacter sp.]